MGYLCQTNEPTPGQNVNFLPEPETVGVDEWTADNNPYCCETEFPVSGTSSGLGNRKKRGLKSPLLFFIDENLCHLLPFRPHGGSESNSFSSAPRQSGIHE